MRPPSWLLFSSLFAACAVSGYFLIKTAQPEAISPQAHSDQPKAPTYPEELSPTHHNDEREKPKGDNEALLKGALPGQRSVTFKDRASMEHFLGQLKGTGVTVKSRLDAIHTLTLSFGSKSQLSSLLEGDEKMGFIFPVLVPEIPDGSIQAGAVGFGDSLLSWLGISGRDQTSWGKGVTVAILDTGVSSNASFINQVTQSTLVDFPSDPTTLNGHGTAVADIIHQIAPDANLLSIRVANDDGVSSSALIAEGILKAVDAGASLINISMGGFGESSVLADAVAYAQSKGVVVVAAPGNQGITQITQPAALPGVIAPTAIDARGDIMAFSNTGQNVGAAAPGYALQVENIDGSATYFTGTSASAPVETGTLAVAMANSSTGNRSANDAVTLANANANEAGQAGYDTIYGNGITNVGRILDSKTAGIYDAAVASHYVSGEMLQVTVQNRGTTPLVNAPLQVSTSGKVQEFMVNSLPAGAIQTFEVPIGTLTNPTTFQSTIGVSSGQQDVNRANNSRTDVYTPASAQ